MKEASSLNYGFPNQPCYYLGHGALTVATHVPDRIRAIVSASGYADRDSYGDANILFDLDLQLAYMDPLMVP